MKNLFLILLILWLSACSNSNSPAPEPKEMVDPFELYPLMIGTTWTYSYIDKYYNTIRTDKIVEKKNTINANGDDAVEYKVIYTLEAEPGWEGQYTVLKDKETLRRSTGSGYVYFRKSEYNKRYYSKFKFIKLPDGREVKTYDELDYIWKKVDITVPAGTFNNCSKITFIEPGTIDTLSKFYFYPGIGMVKNVYYDPGDTTIFELKSYSIGE